MTLSCIARGRYHDHELDSLLDSHPCKSAAIVYSAAGTWVDLSTILSLITSQT